jgi:hypothetical protein
MRFTNVRKNRRIFAFDPQGFLQLLGDYRFTGYYVSGDVTQV